MYFQLVDNQVLSTQGQPEVFNLHRLTSTCQQNAERVIPKYSHGTVMPVVFSTWLRQLCALYGMLHTFQEDCAYLSWDSMSPTHALL